MKICIVDRGHKIPVVNYGGTERVIWGLGKELHALGHEITFLVPKGSSSDFARVIFLDRQRNLNEQIPQDTDVVHFNFTPGEKIEKPYLVTMHGNPEPDEVLDINTVFISRNHAARYNSETFVYNGLSWEDYPVPNLKLPRKGYHFLGKARWSVKNAIGAMKIARRNNESLNVIGGKKWTSRNLKDGFLLLFDSRIKFHGFLGNLEKSKILERSKGLIFPVLWHEPFGLAIIESLYFGCAVFGTTNGSLPELVTPETGYTANSEKEIAEAMSSFKYNPQKCHEYALKEFNSRLMTEKYLNLYEKVYKGEQVNEKVPNYNPQLNRIAEFR